MKPKVKEIKTNTFFRKALRDNQRLKKRQKVEKTSAEDVTWELSDNPCIKEAAQKVYEPQVPASMPEANKGIKKTKKRKRKETNENEKTAKKAKKEAVGEMQHCVDTVVKEEIGDSSPKLTRKQRRNQKKNNSKKNKYKHLAFDTLQGNGNAESVEACEVVKSCDTPKKAVSKKSKEKKLTLNPSVISTKDSTPTIKKKSQKKTVGLKKKKKNNNAVKLGQESDNPIHGSKPPKITQETFSDSDSDDFSENENDSENQKENESSAATKGPVSKEKNANKTPKLSFIDQARLKLNGARFRFLNEQLYTSTGAQALEIFQDDPDAFTIYHQGFQEQVSKWPVNPLDVIIKQLGKMEQQAVIADFGCGEAQLAESLPQNTVHSFDLVASKPCVTVCNIARVPLEANSVHVAVFCLSLMGTNLADYVCEANRVLKQGGTLKIAEVVSRFFSVSGFVKTVETLGFKLHNKEFLGKMFLLFSFKKAKEAPSRKKAPRLTLKACHYKRR